MTILQVLIFAVKLCLLALAAPSLPWPSPLPPLLSDNDLGTNASTPFNITLLGPQFALPHLPNDNYYFPIPFSDEMLKFWDYGSILPSISIREILQDAQRDAAVNIKAGVPMTTTVFRYVSRTGNVRMVIHAKEWAMTWEVYATVIKGLKMWFELWDYVECDFNIGQIGMENLFGTGALVGLSHGMGVDSS